MIETCRVAAGFFFFGDSDSKFDWGGLWWVGVLVIAVSVLIWATKKLKKDKLSGLVDFLQTSGFQIVKVETPFSRSNMPAMHLFGQGRSKSFGAVLEGTVKERRVLLFDYSYVFGLHAQKTFTQTVAAFPIPLGQLPAFELYPSTFLDRIGSSLGMKTLEISDPDLAKRYLFRSSSSPAAYTILNPVLAHLLNKTKTGWWMESSGAWLLLYQRDKSLVSSQDLKQFVLDAAEIARIWLPATASTH